VEYILTILYSPRDLEVLVLVTIDDLITVTTHIYMEFLRLFLRSHFAGKPLVASQKVGRFLRLFRG